MPRIFDDFPKMHFLAIKLAKRFSLSLPLLKFNKDTSASKKCHCS